MSAGTAAGDSSAALAGPAAAGPGPAADAPSAAGRLLGRLSVLPALLVMAWLLTGLPLLMLGWFTWPLMMALSVPVAAAIVVSGLRWIPGRWPGTLAVPGPRQGSTPWWAVAGVIVVPQLPQDVRGYGTDLVTRLIHAIHAGVGPSAVLAGIGRRAPPAQRRRGPGAVSLRGQQLREVTSVDVAHQLDDKATFHRFPPRPVCTKTQIDFWSLGQRSRWTAGEPLGATSAMGQTRPQRHIRAASALPPITEIATARRYRIANLRRSD